MTVRKIHRALLAGAAGTLLTGPAVAQNISNEAWIGQVGVNNTLSVVQEGRANSAGADNMYLLLMQDGVGNKMALTQSGYANKVGTLFANEIDYARGIWQSGDINTIDISQRNTVNGGSNTIGAVQQLSARNILGGAANILLVDQNAIGGLDGAADHYIGRLVQANTTGLGADNLIDILQTGGGSGEGNILANVYQRGPGNELALTQTGQSNLVGENIREGGIWQIGTDNYAELFQDGDTNRLEYLEQAGEANSAKMRLSGDRNVVAHIDQNNESFADDGNLLTIVISGVDNGGAGSVGEFLKLPSLTQTGVLQGAFRQYGGANSATMTITAGADSRYGLTQDGDGNQASITIASAAVTQLAMRNETAIYQKGSLNQATHQILGDDNVASISQDGRRNVVTVTQTGASNAAVVEIVGDDNNKPPVDLFGPAFDVLALAPAGAGLGVVLQLGDGNSVGLQVLGSSNGTAVYQAGSGHIALSTISGNNHALAIVQQSSMNTATTTQSGNGNSLGITQF